MAGYMVEKYFGQFKQDTGHGANILILAVALVLAVVENMLPPPQSPYPE